MKVKEISIQRYGPLANYLFSNLENFTLIYGPNETGKSLTVDALVKLFFEKARDVKKIIEVDKDRVDQKPEGYVLLEKDGKDLKLPEHGTLFGLLQISPEECRNIFIVRASELGLSDEQSFFDSVIHRLLGLESEKINKVAEELKRIGRLVSPTSSAELSDSADDKKPRSRIQKARTLRTRIAELQKKATEQGLENKEKLLAQLLDRQARLASQITEQEAARDHERYHKGRQSLERVIACAKDLEALGGYTEEELREWENSEQEIVQITAIIKSIEAEIETRKTKQNELERQIREHEQELNDQQQKEGRVEALELACKDYAQKWQKFIQAQVEGKTLRNYSYASLLAFLISSALSIVREDWVWISLAILAFLFFLVIVVRAWLRVAILNSRVVASFEQLKQDAVKCEFPPASDLEEILRQIESNKSSLKSKQRRLQELKTELSIVKSELTRQELDLTESRLQLERLEERINLIRSRSGASQITSYRERLSEKIRLQNQLSQNESALNALWTTPEKDPNRKIQFWKEKVEGIRLFENAAHGVQFDEIVLRKFREQHQQCQKDIEDIKQSLTEWQRELTELAHDVADVIWDGATRVCHSLSGLSQLDAELQDFEISIIQSAEQARTAIGILEAIRKEEDTKVVSLFSEVMQASDIFSKITSGRYVGILYDATNGELRVRTATGEEIDASKLSSGAYDQLHMAIRLALAQKILDGKGFFILDDPFIRSDPTRLKNQLLILRDLTADGWQFIYFSAKGEVRELFRHVTNNKDGAIIDLASRT
jgi:hypothetical protein